MKKEGLTKVYGGIKSAPPVKPSEPITSSGADQAQHTPLKIQYIFYVLGIIFLFITVAYFSYEYVFNLSDSLKTVILICLIIVFFFLADFLAGKGV